MPYRALRRRNAQLLRFRKSGFWRTWARVEDQACLFRGQEDPGLAAMKAMLHTWLTDYAAKAASCLVSGCNYTRRHQIRIHDALRYLGSVFVGHIPRLHHLDLLLTNKDNTIRVLKTTSAGPVDFNPPRVFLAPI